MLSQEITPADVRKEATPASIRFTANQVAGRRCQCCPGEGDEQMECGHYRCRLCVMRGHDVCIACALAV